MKPIPAYNCTNCITLFYPQNGTYSNIPIQNYYNSCYISKFTSAHVRTHATYYGGMAETIPNTISAFQGLPML